MTQDEKKATSSEMKKKVSVEQLSLEWDSTLSLLTKAEVFIIVKGSSSSYSNSQVPSACVMQQFTAGCGNGP